MTRIDIYTEEFCHEIKLAVFVEITPPCPGDWHTPPAPGEVEIIKVRIIQDGGKLSEDIKPKLDADELCKLQDLVNDALASAEAMS